jgi:hypothetical protein
MTETEGAILKELMGLQNAIARMATTTPKPNLLDHFNRIENLTRELPKTTAPELLHYLHRKSYEKARLFLEGRDTENLPGVCGTRSPVK